jgi:hypothetical protein
VVSSFVVISVIVAADMVLADPAGRSSMVIATSRAGWSAAFEITGTAITDRVQAIRKIMESGFMKPSSGFGER